MCCLTEKLFKLLLIVLNIVFMVLGLGILIPGVLMLTNIDFLSDNITPLLDKISISGLNLGNIANNLPIVFIAVGLFILCVATIGFLGAYCELKTLLVVYGIIVLILTVAQIIVLIFFFILRTGLFDDTLKSEFQNELQTSYRQDSLDKSDEVSSGYNYMFILMECCGINAVTASTNDFDNTPWRLGTGAGKKIPKGCCIGVTEDNYNSFTNAACTDTATSGTYHADNCYDKILSNFGSILDAMGYICLIAVLVQIIIVVVAFCLCCSLVV